MSGHEAGCCGGHVHVSIRGAATEELCVPAGAMHATASVSSGRGSYTTA
ncbi:MAG TPA: hypothetical protein VJQ52_06220 [Steroidobacteraceae bacterium]|nr:hypothetical protein [Steroidobacteraceae bacterium]